MNHTSIDLEYHPKKIAVLFPGVGYHTDKPLLYYSKKLAKYLGFEILEVAYPPLPSGIKGSPDKMEEAFPPGPGSDRRSTVFHPICPV